MYAVIFNSKDLSNPTQIINEIECITSNKYGITIHSKYVNKHTQINATVKVYSVMGNLVSTITHGNIPMLQKIKKLLKGE